MSVTSLRLLSGLVLAGLAFTATAAPAPADKPRVLSVSPQGDVENFSQITARFSDDMVRVGDKSVRNPFIVDCPAKGQGRWVNTRTWSWTPASPVEIGKSCKFTFVAGLKTAEGTSVLPVTPVVVTARPAPAAARVAAPAGKALLELFSPQGETRTVRQVQARFSEPMVRFGDPQVYNPFIISCGAKGKGRWVDTRNWAYDFEKDLPSGLACEFTLVSGLKSLAGNPVTSFPKYRFSTGGPDVIDVRPYRDDDNIDENQTFLLKFDGALDRFSLPKASYCMIEGINERVPVRYLAAAETESFVAKLPEDIRNWWREKSAYTDFGQREVAEWRALTCSRSLPPGKQVKLVFSRELASAAGVSSSADQVLDYRVRPAFTADFSCSRENARQACSPMADMYLRFSSTVDADMLKAVRLEGAGKSWAPAANAEGDEYESGGYLTFKGPFPAEAALTLKLPATFTDDSGRRLTNAARFPLAVKTAAYPPLAKFSANFGVIELAAGAVPLTVRNLEPGAGVGTDARLHSLKLPEGDADLVRWLARFRKYQDKHSCYTCMDRNDAGDPIGRDPRSQPLLKGLAGVQTQVLPKKLGAKEFEVIGLPVPQPGVYVHEVESRYLGDSLIYNKAPMFVSAMSVVTNLGVHLRSGEQNAMVWVTSLDKAQPVPNAEVGIWDCKGSTQLWNGRSDARGIARIDRKIDLSEWGDCMGSRYVVVARSGNDRALVLPNWSEGIQSWRFNLPWSSSNTGSVIAHSILDRSLFRAGETVHIRHVLRELTLTGLRAPQKLKAEKISVFHDGSDQEYTLPVNIDAQGNGENTWTIPKTAKLGNYRIVIQTKDRSFELAQFRVAEFRLPVLKATLQLPRGPQAAVDKLPVDMQLQYLNGGAYGEVPVSLRGRVSPASTYYSDFEDFTFGRSDDGQTVDLELRELKLDKNGGLRASQSVPAVTRPSDVVMEMEFRDPSGETQTVSSRATLWPAAVQAGIRVPSWASSSSNDAIPVDIVTLGTDGKPRANVPVKLSASLHSQQTHRKRTVGGFYAYETVEKNENVPVNCAGNSDASGRFTCRIQAKVSGELTLAVEARDGNGRSMRSETTVWVSGGDRWWFDQDNNDRIDLIPEKKQYEPGDTMRLQVRMPFDEATALVSIERDGTLESFVQTISSKNATITLPVKAEYAPNVFVSAFLIRGRNDAVAPTALIDLGKPAFKLGIANIKVGWDAFRLGVKVEADKPRYHPRDKAEISVQVSPPAGQALPANTQVTLAAVDEALLELADNKSWDLLTPMMAERGYEMSTATSQLQVVGKRHYGRKALPPGGGGGRGMNTRELFDTLLFWKGSATVDASGRARFTVPLNDSLTGFKIVAVASSENRFGTGDTRIESYQDIQIVSGLPILLRQGDRLTPGFTVRNTSDKTQDLQFHAEITGMGTVIDKRLTLAPGKAEEVLVPLVVPMEVDTLRWTVSATGNGVSDRMQLTQKVLDAVPERVLQSTLFQLETPQDIPVAKPKGALPGGALQVSGQAKLADSLGTVTEWFRNYPYVCLEQKTSKAVGTQDEAMWAGLMEMLPAYLDDNGLAAFYPGSRGYPFLTAYLLNLSHAIGWDVPAASRERMLKGLQDYAEGRLEFDDWRFNALDDTQRKLEVLGVLAKYGKFRPGQLESVNIDPPRWSARMLVDWLDLLKAANTVPRRAERLAQAESLLRSRLTLQGSMLTLTSGDYTHWWLYDNRNVTMARLILATRDLPAWREDQPKLLRALTQYQREGRWDTTIANLWGGIALKRFSEQFESEPVSGSTTLALGAQKASLAWATPKPEPVRLAWPEQPDVLKVAQAGSGKPWITVQSRARLPLTAPLSTGFSIQKTVKPVQQKVAGQWSAGDVMRVRLTMNAQSDIGWVVVDDPVPAGATLLGRALARDSALLASGEQGGWVWPTFAEYAADAYRAYYERIYKGEWSVEYTVRLNQSGTFKLPATRVEAMYAPEMFGMTPNADFTVKP